MASIVIREADLTRAGLSTESTDVVYIPGFVDLTQSKLTDANGNYIGIPLNEPKLFKTLEEFTSMVGDRGAVFEADQAFPDDFATLAKPSTGAMFTVGTIDPSYIMAKELLSRGLPVLYERVNSDRTNNYTQASGITADTFKDYILYTASTGENPTYTVATEFTTGTTYYKSNDAITVAKMYDALSECFASGTLLEDKGEYQIKYLTSGGYPVFEFDEDGATNTLVASMIALAEKRQDCVAIIDHTRNTARAKTGTGAVYTQISDTAGNYKVDSEFAAMFTPYKTYPRNSIDSDGTREHTGANAYANPRIIKNDSAAVLPASFGYLLALARSTVNYPNWLAIAGVTRGKLPTGIYTTPEEIISNAQADAMQPRTGIAINSITNIKPYGDCIWGNRTLKNNQPELTATSFLNIRNMVSDIKKLAYTTAKSLTFEQNNDILWINFKAGISPLLDKLKSGSGIADYKIIKQPTDQKAKLVAQIIIYPLYAVEDFDITIVMEDQDVTVE